MTSHTRKGNLTGLGSETFLKLRNTKRVARGSAKELLKKQKGEGMAT